MEGVDVTPPAAPSPAKLRRALMAAAEEEDDGESPRATSHSAKRGLSLRSTSRGSAVAPRRCVSMRAGVELGSESPHAANTAPRVPQTSGATAARLRAEVSVHRLTHQALRKVLGGEARADDASEDPADARDVLRNARVVLDIADKMIVDSRAGSSFPAAAGGGLRPRRQDSLASTLSLRENTELSAAARGYLREYAAAGTDGDDAFDDSVQLAAAAYDSVNLSRHNSRKLREELEFLRWRRENADPDPASASASADLASTIDSWDAFDAVALDERLRRARPDLNPSDPSGVLVETTLAAAEKHDLVDSAGVDRGSLADFLRSLEREYRRPDYHTAVHAADVVQAVSFLLSKGLRDQIDADAAFALVVAAAAHDAGHPGLNNAHLVRTEDPAATRWNDVSVNENGHLHVALRLLRQHGVTRGWEAERARGFRAMLGRLILSTDMENHARIVADFVDAAASAGMRKDGTDASSGSPLAAFEPIDDEDGNDDQRRDAKGEGREVEGGGEGKSPSPSLSPGPGLGPGPGVGGAARVGSWRDPTLALCYVLHCADVSNPARPFAVAREWGRRVCEEFYKQGDVERELGLPVAAFCDRSLREGDETDAANQMAFMDFVVKPTLEALATALPEAADVMLEHLSRNRAGYERIVDPSLATRRASMEERRRSVSAEPTP